MSEEIKELNPEELENAAESMELSADMLDQVSGGTIYKEFDEGEKKYKYKVFGRSKYTGNYYLGYFNDLEEALKAARSVGISEDVVEVD